MGEQVGRGRRLVGGMCVGGAAVLQFVNMPSAGANWAPLNSALANCAAGLPGSVNPGDNKSLVYFRSDLTANNSSAVASHMSYINSLTATYGVSASEAGSISSTTDEVVFDQAYTTYCGRSWTLDGNTGTFGLTSCLSHNSVGECEKNEVRLTTRIGSLTDTAVERQKLACHETGHALGLLHRDTNPQEGCMPTSTDTMVEARYSDHDKNHLQNDLN